MLSLWGKTTRSAWTSSPATAVVHDLHYIPHSHFTTEDHWNRLPRDPANGLVRGLRRTPGERADSRPARTEPGRPRGAASTRRRCHEIPPQRGLYASSREEVLLLAGTVPGDDTCNHHDGGSALRQHAIWCADGNRRHQRRSPLCVRHRLAWCLRHRDCRVGVEFEVSVS